MLLSPQLDEPVEDKEDKKAEEQHVAEQFGLAPSGQLLYSANGGSQQSACRIKVRVLWRDEGGIRNRFKSKKMFTKSVLLKSHSLSYCPSVF